MPQGNALGVRPGVRMYNRSDRAFGKQVLNFMHPAVVPIWAKGRSICVLWIRLVSFES